MNARHPYWITLTIVCAGAAWNGCSGADEGGAKPNPGSTPSIAGSASTTVMNPATTPGASGSAGAQSTAPASASGAAGRGATIPTTLPPMAAGAPSTPPTPPATSPMTPRPPALGAAGAAAPANPLPGGTPPAAAGPEDGPAGGAVIAIPDVACGGPTRSFGLGSANFMMDGRDMIVTYPCNKHAAAPASFILNLHGTTPPEQHFYQHGYFSAHQFSASHNLIIVTPSSVVQQWGNGDDGQDEPHLMKIIDWVYANLNGPEKFDIKAMWVGGHSWGGAYTARFGCKAELADKVKGLIMMSGGGVGSFGGAACASKVAVIITTAEGDGRMPSDQSMLAGTHGCQAGMSQMILNNVHNFWPTCQPGFVHANYYMLGKEHATFMDKEVVESIANWIKLQRQ